MLKIAVVLLALKLAAVCAGGIYWWRNRPQAWSKKPFAWRFCPGCRGKLVMGEVGGKPVQKCSVCDQFANWNNPIPVAVVLVPKNDGFILARRGISPGKGKLALVSGYVDPFETPAQTAVREVLEEICVHIEIDRELSVRVPPNVNQNLHFFLAKPITETPVAGDETEEVLEVKKDAVPWDQIAFSMHSETIRDWIASAA
jgi:ADP-ribose pyrophosphatase YjhB (NUDIX family)